jgi:hypothetical protein
MSTLHYLRHGRIIARLVLALFTLAMAVAIAAPVFNPQGMALVCSVAGQVKLISVEGNASLNGAGSGAPTGSAMDTSHGWNCVLCIALDAPPVPADIAHLVVQPAASLLVRSSHEALPAEPARTFPARGPPAWA